MEKIILSSALSGFTRPQPTREENYLFVGDRLPDYLLPNVSNYKKALVTVDELRDHNSKLLLLHFWFSSCKTCTGQWSRLISLQEQFRSRLRIVSVTSEPYEIAGPFIKQWEEENAGKMELVLVTGDTILHESFRQLHNPHYVWIAPNGVVLAQTGSSFINTGLLEVYLQAPSA